MLNAHLAQYGFEANIDMRNWKERGLSEPPVNYSMAQLKMKERRDKAVQEHPHTKEQERLKREQLEKERLEKQRQDNAKKALDGMHANYDKALKFLGLNKIDARLVAGTSTYRDRLDTWLYNCQELFGTTDETEKERLLKTIHDKNLVFLEKRAESCKNEYLDNYDYTEKEVQIKRHNVHFLGLLYQKVDTVLEYAQAHGITIQAPKLVYREKIKELTDKALEPLKVQEQEQVQRQEQPTQTPQPTVRPKPPSPKP